MILTTKDASLAMENRIVNKAVQAVSSSGNSASVQTNGDIVSRNVNGEYDSEAVWTEYIKCDLDSIDSGLGCAP